MAQQWTISKRPHTFKDLDGCSNIKDYYYNLVKAGEDFPKANLFQGQIGGGKTTAAKILAQMIVCKHKTPEGDPCCECDDCKAVMDETFDRTVLMVDGTITHAEDMRNVLERFVTVPSIHNDKKVLILEEFTELSSDTQKFCLKYLESPQEDVYYIFTAMDDMKGTSIANKTRSVTFKLKPAEPMELWRYMKSVLQSTPYHGTRTSIWDSSDVPISFKKEGLLAIAECAKGSRRDALQMLQQCIVIDRYDVDSLSDIGIKSALQVVGALNLLCSGVEEKHLHAIKEALIEGDYISNYTMIMSAIANAECYSAFGEVYNRYSSAKIKDPNTEEDLMFKDVSEYAEQLATAEGKGLIGRLYYKTIRDHFVNFMIENKGWFPKANWILCVSTAVNLTKLEKVNNGRQLID